MKKILDILCMPFQKEFSFFLMLVLLASITDVVAWFLYNEPIFAVYLGLHGYLMCYVIALVYSTIKNKYLRRIYTTVFISLGIISCFIDIVCHKTLHIGFTMDLVSIIMGTNPAESFEFTKTFFTVEVCLLFIVVLFVFGIIFYSRSSIDRLGQKLTYFCLLVLLVGATAIFLKKSQNWDGIYLYKIKTFFSYSAPRDLKQYLQNPSIDKESDGPQNVVLIIGESFSKYHSSLYGYEKNTK